MTSGTAGVIIYTTSLHGGSGTGTTMLTMLGLVIGVLVLSVAVVTLANYLEKKK